MDTVTKEEFEMRPVHFTRLIKDDALFIYPTDTIYGIGCNAASETAVEKLRGVKSRYTRPFSVIAPSKDWIIENCVMGKREQEWVDKLPGPYTLIMKLKDGKAIAPSTNVGLSTIGIRIPDHWFTKHIAKMGIPIVTTSANLTGNDHMTKLEDLDTAIRRKTSFIIYEGEKKARPSTLVDLTQDVEKLVER